MYYYYGDSKQLLLHFFSWKQKLRHKLLIRSFAIRITLHRCILFRFKFFCLLLFSMYSYYDVIIINIVLNFAHTFKIYNLKHDCMLIISNYNAESRKWRLFFVFFVNNTLCSVWLCYLFSFLSLSPNLTEYDGVIYQYSWGSVCRFCKYPHCHTWKHLEHHFVDRCTSMNFKNNCS